MDERDRLLEELVGASTAKRLEMARALKWNIEEALTTSYTHREMRPPSDSDFSSQSVNAGIKLGNLEYTIIGVAKNEYEPSDDSEAVKKLHRVGLQAIDIEWGNEITRITESKDTLNIISNNLGANPLRVYSNERNTIPIQTLGQETESIRILWNQKTHGKRLSDELDIHQTQIYQLSLIMAGRELGYHEKMGPEKVEQIEQAIEATDSLIQTRAQSLELIARGGILSLMEKEKEKRSEALAKLGEDCPYLMDRFFELARIAEGEGDDR